MFIFCSSGNLRLELYSEYHECIKRKIREIKFNKIMFMGKTAKYKAFTVPLELGLELLRIVNEFILVEYHTDLIPYLYKEGLMHLKT